MKDTKGCKGKQHVFTFIQKYGDLWFDHQKSICTENPSHYAMGVLLKAILRDLIRSAPLIYILLNKFSVVYINR